MAEARVSDVDVDVLVVGGGPVGLLSAIELTRRGVRVRVVERESTHTPFSKASVIHVRNQELLSSTGVIEKIRAVGHPMHPTRVNAFGKILGDLNLQGVDSPFVGPWIIFQSETEQILIEHLASLGVGVEWRTEFLDLEQLGDSVRVRIRDAAGKVEVVRARWLLGCDGSASAVRDQSGIPYEGKKYDEEFQFQLADVTMDAVPKDRGEIYLTPSGAFVLLVPQYEGERIILTKPRDEPLSAQAEASGDAIVHGTTREVLTLDELQVLTKRYGPADAEITDPVWLSRFRIHVRLAKRYRADRVLIAGDAAHIHVPMGGQGMNTGFGDAVNLAWKLALVVKDEAPESLLDSYGPERRPVAETIVKSTDDMFMRISKPTRRFMWAARTIAPRVFPRAKVQNRIRTNVAQFNVHYPKSAIVEDHRARRRGGPEVGDRAPDAILNGERPEWDSDSESLFKAFMPEAWFSLLVFEDDTTGGGVDYEALLKAISPAGERLTVFAVTKPDAAPSARPAGVRVLVDHTGAAHERYGAQRSTLWLVRPDKYLGFCGPAEDVDALGSYLGGIFV